MVASGNDFVVARLQASRAQLKNIALKICDRKNGVGADGLLVLEKSRVADVKMRVFNADGSEAEMCGNGARCVALWAQLQKSHSAERAAALKIETKAGIISCQITDNRVKIKLVLTGKIIPDIPIRVKERVIRVNAMNTGVPHAVIFAEGLGKFDIIPLGRFIRYHKKFSPRGTNVNFVEVLGRNAIRVRTYERGVEDETLACGTGSVASALIFAFKTNLYAGKISVLTQSRDILTVYFRRIVNSFDNVWLEGSAREVYKGEYYV